MMWSIIYSVPEQCRSGFNWSSSHRHLFTLSLTQKRHFKLIHCLERKLIEGKQSKEDAWVSCCVQLKMNPEPLGKCYHSGYEKKVNIIYFTADCSCSSYKLKLMDTYPNYIANHLPNEWDAAYSTKCSRNRPPCSTSWVCTMGGCEWTTAERCKPLLSLRISR